MTAAPISAAVIGRIRAYRTARQMSAQQLAHAITAAGHPISRAVLSNQENGRVETIPVDQVVAAAEAFGIPVDDLLRDAPCPTCTGLPPAGFMCNTCRKGAAL